MALEFLAVTIYTVTRNESAFLCPPSLDLWQTDEDPGVSGDRTPVQT